jgi:SAM-dependent methyltransferase
VYVLDPPARDELGLLYSFASGYHAELADDGSPESRLHRARAAASLEIVRRHHGPGRLLDVGCSAGFFLACALAAGWEAQGVELSDDAAELARRRGLDVVTGTIELAELAPRSFDVVTMWDVLEHVEDPLATLRQAAELLGDGGLLFVSTPNVDGLFPRFSYRLARLAGRWPHPEPPRHLFQFSKATLGRFLREAGFETIETIDRRIPLGYTFGRLRDLLRAPGELAYATAFAPLAVVGPLLHAGDEMVVVARIRRDAATRPSSPTG